MEYTKHETVLREECVTFLTEKGPFGKESLFADLTFGGGGHSRELLSQLKKGRLIAFDQDQDSLKNIIQNKKIAI